MVVLLPGTYLIELEITRPIDSGLLVSMLERFGFTNIVTDPAFGEKSAFGGMGRWLFSITVNHKIAVNNINGIRWTLIRKLDPTLPSKGPFMVQTHGNYILRFTADSKTYPNNKSVRYHLSKLGFQTPRTLRIEYSNILDQRRVVQDPISEWIAISRWNAAPKVIRQSSTLKFQQIREI